MGGEADLVETLHRLLARARLLLRYQQHLSLAVEEALGWLQVPPTAVPLNAATMDAQIWRTIGHVASAGENISGEIQENARDASAPVALLQTGWPTTADQLQSAVPGMPLPVIAGLRRRAWRVNAATVLGSCTTAENVTVNGGEVEGPSGLGGAAADCDLYLLQTEPSSSLLPPERCGPLPRLSGRGLDQQRRRHRAPRPLPVVRDPRWMSRRAREATESSDARSARSRSRDESPRRAE